MTQPPDGLLGPATDVVERLRLAEEVEHRTGLRKIRLRKEPAREQRVRTVVKLVRAREARRVAGQRMGPAFIDSLLVRALAIAAAGKPGWRARLTRPDRAISTARTVPVAGYATSSVSEQPVVRISILLALMRRRSDAIDLLVERIRSGLGSDRARLLLANLLERGGEKRSAIALRSTVSDVQSFAPPAARRHRSQLRYAIVVPTLFDTEVFRSSLRSLVGSDFDGHLVVVEDGLQAGEECREYCESLPVRYLKKDAWEGSAAAMNLAIHALPADTDIVLFAHNDVLWPSEWFRSLDRAWAAGFNSQRLGLLSLGYLQFKQSLDPELYELFVRGAYDDLRWILNAATEVPELVERIQSSQVHSGELYGLARDPWNDWTPDARFMTGRFSVGTSFPLTLWRELGGFGADLPYGFDVELQHRCLETRRLMLFVDNPPLIHLSSVDTRLLDQASSDQFRAKVRQTYETFERQYGWQLEHYLNLYFSETAFIHRNAILTAANALRFEDVDFIFDDFASRLRERTLANCELTWCRSRSRCPYVDPPLGARISESGEALTSSP